MALPADFIAYFRDAIGGDSAKTWFLWWRENAGRAELELSRLDFLELKFRRLEGAALLLEREGAAIPWSLAGRRLAAWARLGAAALDEHGRPSATRRERAYGGLFGKIATNDQVAAVKVTKRLVRQSRSLADRAEAGQSLGELVLDLDELHHEYSNGALLAALAEIVSLGDEDAFLAPAIGHARELLARLRENRRDSPA